MSRKVCLVFALVATLLASSCSNDTKVSEHTMDTDVEVTTASTEEKITGISLTNVPEFTTTTTAASIASTEETTTASITTTTTEETTAAPFTTTSTAEITYADNGLSGTVSLVDDVEPATETTGTTAVTNTGSTNVYYKSSLSEKAWAFLEDCVFVGDSICSGLKAYEILPRNNVLAIGNTAARNIFEDWAVFKVDGKEMDIVSALAVKQPDVVVFSMGMNDVNMTTEEQFCSNYDILITKAREVLPNATFYVFSITPVTYKDDGRLFTRNSNIDSFNAQLKAHLAKTGTATFIDVASELKNGDNLLRADYVGSPDGVHLAPGAYYAMMYQFIDQIFD